ncbi:MAG: YggS family pyridoxal phosphate-dependent enzyme [Actinomycetaceae bacterium]|nr:YggS family pyridoxal phosphate-dependent enzyme [Actinomycetaceae bacterium]
MSHDRLMRERLSHILQEVAKAEHAAGRHPDAVTVELAVKTQSVIDVAAAASALEEMTGRRAVLGHNRVQELLSMIENWPPGAPEVEWHYIGRLQSNKMGQVLRTGALIETVDSAQTLTRLENRLEASSQKYPIYMQVNTSGEDTKAGCDPREALALARQIYDSQYLDLCGLMTIGTNTEVTEDIAQSYRKLRELRDQISHDYPRRDGLELALSMGMTKDFTIAIAQGATIVRLGTGVFGPRA